jgi:hypothetical protein
VRREMAVAVWVGPKSKVKIPPTSTDSGQVLSPRSRKGRGSQTQAGKKAYRTGMDISWLDERIAVGGAIWHSEGKMADLKALGVTHIINMQQKQECDDTELGEAYGIKVLSNGTDDDFEPKPAALFWRGVDFALKALESSDAKVFIHCAAGIHRAPMMALALLGAMGWNVEDARELIEDKRPVADFAEVYVQSVRDFLDGAGFPTS